MKTKLSITVDDDVVRQIEAKVQEGLFRNKSHALEFAIRRFLRE